MEGSQLSSPLIAPGCLEEVMLWESLAESWICLLGPVGTCTVYQVGAACGFNLTPRKTCFHFSPSTSDSTDAIILCIIQVTTDDISG